MRSPSARVLRNRVDIYFATAIQDGVKAPTYIYNAAPDLRAVPCSVQVHEVSEVVEGGGGSQQRVIIERQYRVTFPVTTGLSARDKILYTDDAGVQHILFVHVERDEAGRGSAFTVWCIEKNLT